jgi:hypothetical protein
MAGCEKKQHLFLVLFTFFNEREVLNKHCFLNLNNLSSVQQKHTKSQNLCALLCTFKIIWETTEG